MSTVAGAFDNKTRDFKTNAKNNNELFAVKHQRETKYSIKSRKSYHV